MTRKPTLVPAKDGIIARVVEPWNSEKLFYVNGYMDIFCTGMKNSWSALVYADLLAAPGVCMDAETKTESPGSPLLALNHQEFNRLFFNDAVPRVAAALCSRIPADCEERVRVRQADCNEVVSEARQFLFPSASRGSTLGLAVIDPTAFQIRFDSIAQLAANVHLDLLVVFMTGYVRRFLGRPGFPEKLDAFFGTNTWRDLLTTRDEGQKVTYRRLLDLYEEQLATLGYTHVNDDARIINSKQATIYHIVFASKHPKGEEFFKKISRRTYSGMRRMF